MSLFFNPITLWLIVTRLSGWMILSPGFTEINTPQLTRVYFLIWLSVLIMPLVEPAAVHLNSLPELMTIMLSEFMIGAGYGLVLRIIFSGIQLGGIMIDSELGLLAAQQLNPFLPQSSGFFSRLFLLVAILYFWVDDYFQVVFLALRQSFVLIPLGSMAEPQFDLEMFTRLGAGIFIGGITFAAPIIALMFFVNISIGFLARTVQGLNLFTEGFIVKIIVGFLGVQYFLQLLFRFVRVQLQEIIPMSDQYFQALVKATGSH
jgi:flagellar biosynthetic protein FliR